MKKLRPRVFWRFPREFLIGKRWVAKDGYGRLLFFCTHILAMRADCPNRDWQLSMHQLPPTNQQAISGGPPPRPGLLIAFWVGVYALMWAMHGAIAVNFVFGNSPYGMQVMWVLSYLGAIVLNWHGLIAWWLAMFVAHTRRSIGIPIACVAMGPAWNSILLHYSRTFNSANFFFDWNSLHEELWRQFSPWYFASTGMHLVCIGGLCYLVSRLTSLQLNQRNHSPQPITFDISRILGLTLMVAVVFAAVRWSTSSKPEYLRLLSSDFATAFSALSGLTTGVNWAIVSWVYAKGSVRLGVIAVVCLMLIQFAMSLFSFWTITYLNFNSGNAPLEPSLGVVVGYNAVSVLWILLVIRVVHFCGYQLNFYRRGTNVLPNPVPIWSNGMPQEEALTSQAET